MTMPMRRPLKLPSVRGVRALSDVELATLYADLWSYKGAGMTQPERDRWRGRCRTVRRELGRREVGARILRADAAHLYDLVVCSLDYGSGFLCADDDAMLARVASMLGIERPGDWTAAQDRKTARERSRAAQ